ncbi:hypothetical protein [Plantibacter sp. YIM 135347]|uniref:hypothetical protein n=1 Tax=Plantibacter sp. YIM 135347 TaxID=3423919 RepID=UPI003D32F203
MSSERTTLTREQRRSRFWAGMAMSWVSQLILIALCVWNLIRQGIQFTSGVWEALGTAIWLFGLVFGVVGLIGGIIWRRRHPPL